MKLTAQGEAMLAQRALRMLERTAAGREMLEDEWDVGYLAACRDGGYYITSDNGG